MRVGVWIPCYRRWIGGEAVRQIATAAEQLGFGSLWVQDHLVAPTGDSSPVELQASWLNPDDYGNEAFSAVEYYGEENWWLDPYALWGFLAGITERVELASGIVVLPYRDPVAQAKMLGTLDVLSGGRMVFGIGAGHVAAEFDALGIPYRERGRRTDEYIDVMRALLRGRETSFDGPTVKLPSVLPLIEPVQRPMPPFLIGGGSRAAIRRAVDRGDGWLPAHVAPEHLGRGIAYMEEYAASVGREPVPVSLSMVTRIVDPAAAGGPQGRRRALERGELEELLGGYASLGLERLAIDLPNPNLPVLMRQLELLADVVAGVGV
ncbi:TIGR03619 family F420-dependent LLM class oxidoreductase [Conexibacter sp. CPCC 206217]|uniref:TIGR03619 family F420-dependent LLM class oxidoreductase n=1 Tax=Conexibacter sp. CPCC 206217 TaxID=3064574 RepID=UPI002724FD5E|nr:TIGR03619 family F420-dependent LLM class oxidoreductase [Conexibacter sp. CPCC 206217]MDO8211111.1 TIGR03619 family F420-dependent LLM class oxidoreductase [Conexibacter sp. CPCC 206217]